MNREDPKALPAPGPLRQSEAERSLLENERRLATLLSNLPGMAYRCRNDAGWTMEFVSDGCETLTGYKPGDLLDGGIRTYSSLIHPGDRERIWNEVQEAVSRQRRFRMTYRIITADGTEKWVWEQGVGIFSAAGLEALEGFITDITDRKLAEARSQAQNERFQRVIEHADAGYFRIGLDGRFEDVNPAWLRMYGFTRKDEAVGLHYSAVQAPDDAAKAKMFVAALERGEPVRCAEFSRLRRDGPAGCHSFSANPVFDGDRIAGFEGFLVDITGQRTAERERRESEQRYLSLFNSVHEGVGLHRLTYSGGKPDNYVLLDVNSQYEAIIGKKREDVAGKLATVVYGTEDPPYLKEFSSVIETATPFQFETYFAPLDKYFFISVAPMGGDIFATTFFDVTEQKKTEEAMRSLVTAIEHAEEQIVVTGRDGRIQYCNPAFEKVTGYSRSEAIGQNPRILKSGEHSREFYAGLWAALNQGVVWRGHLINRKKNGARYEEDATISPIPDALGQIAGFVAIKRDVTQQLQLERQLLQSQKLESVGRLAGGVAHDFNNLLTVINGHAAFLAEGIDRRDPLWSSAEEILKAGERAAALTRQLLAFSRKEVIQLRALDLNTTMRDSEHMLQRLIGEDIALVTQLDPGLGQVMADPEQMHQVMMNLVVNARDAMPDGGRLEIATANVEVAKDGAGLPAAARLGRYVVVTVSDTGSGIDDQTREHIFEPFFTTKGPDKGTGLGLSTVYGIMQQSGGWIEVSSELGSGTSFRLYFPRIDACPLAAAVEVARTGLAHGGETILMVEDEDAVRRFTKAVLEAYGYRVLEAANGDAAVDLARNHPGDIHLLLTDVVLPGINGREVSERVMAARPNVKVLFVSGYTSDIIAHHGVLDNGVAYIPKPFSPAGLATKVQELLAASAPA